MPSISFGVFLSLRTFLRSRDLALSHSFSLSNSLYLFLSYLVGYNRYFFSTLVPSVIPSHLHLPSLFLLLSTPSFSEIYCLLAHSLALSLTHSLARLLLTQKLSSSHLLSCLIVCPLAFAGHDRLPLLVMALLHSLLHERLRYARPVPYNI